MKREDTQGNLILLGTPSVNSSNFLGTKTVVFAPWYMAMPKSVHLDDSELFASTKGTKPLPCQGLKTLQLVVASMK